MLNGENSQGEIMFREKINSIKHYYSCLGLSSLLFLLGMFLYVSGNWLNHTNIYNISPIMHLLIKNVTYILAMALFLISLIKNKPSARHCVVIAIIGFLVGGTVIVSGSKQLFWIYLVVCASQGTTLRDIAKITLCSTIFILVLVLLLFTTHIIPEFVLDDVASRGIRHSLGYTHPNTFAAAIFTINLALTFLFSRKNGFASLIVIIVLAIFSHVVTGSRTFDLGNATLVVINIFSMLKIPNSVSNLFLSKISKNIVYLILVFVATISIVAMFTYSSNNQILAVLNQALSGRIRLSNIYMQYSGITLFGADFSDAPYYSTSSHGEILTFVVDNLYQKVFLQFGVVGFCLLFFPTFYLLHKMIEYKSCTTIYYLISLILFLGISESAFLWIQLNFLISYLRIAIYQSDIEILNI